MRAMLVRVVTVLAVGASGVIAQEPGLITGTVSVSGRVLDADTGQPVAGARVRGVGPEGRPPGDATSVLTDADGRYVLRDIHMRRLPAFCVEAILTRDGMPASLDFRVEEEDVSRLQSLNSPNPPWLRGGRSGPDGRIRVCDLVDGRFRVTALETARVIETVRSGSVGFVVDGADVHAGMVAAEPPVTVSGEVRWDRPPAALSVPDVFRFSTTATFGAGGVSVSSIPGQFSMRVLAGMPYSFLVSGLQPPLYLKDISFGGDSILNGVFVPAPAGDQRLVLTIGADAGAMLVSVRDRSGQPVGNVGVLVMADNGWSELDAATSIAAAALTDDSGGHIVEGLRPGRYFALATPDLPSYVVNLPIGTLRLEKSPETLATLLRARAHAQRVEVPPGSRVRVSLEPIAIP